MATEMTAVMAEAQRGGTSARLQEQAIRHRLRIAMDDVHQLRFELASYGKGAAGEERLADAVVTDPQMLVERTGASTKNSLGKKKHGLLTK